MAETAQGNGTESAATTPQFEWNRVLGQLKQEVGETAYRRWLAPVSVQRIDAGEAVIGAPARFFRDWIASHYADRILALWRAQNRHVKRVSVIVAPASRMPGTAGASRSEDHMENRPERGLVAAPVAVLEIGEDRAQQSGLDQRFTFENFVVGKPNELAHAAA